MSIEKLNTDSSPGPDGLTSKFYIFFSRELVPFLEVVYNQIYADKQLPAEHQMSYITLLPKDSGSLLFPKNYRPISLLNTEYKILTTTLANRLSPHMKTLIHPDQTCAIKDRSIFTHGHFIRDFITHTNKTHSHNCILSVDQAKAYDRVAHDWLNKVIKKCNLGSFYEHWIQIICKNAKSKIIVNNTLTDTVEIGRGVRQGDPLSGILYILTIEPLLNCIRADNNIPSICLPGDKQRKLAGYADDTNFFLEKHSSVDIIIDHFQLFTKASGSKINVDKTQALALGSWKKHNFNSRNKIRYVDDIKILGFYFTKNPETCGKSNWEKALKAAENTLERFFIKTTSIFGRAVIVNALIEPQFIYPLQVFDPPKRIFQKYNLLIRPFILKGSNHHIKQKILFLPKHRGGVNLHNLELKHTSMRMKRVHTFLNNPDIDEMSRMYYHLSYHAKKHVHFNNNRPHCLYKLPTFYENCKCIYDHHNDIITKMTPIHYYDKLIDKSATNIDVDIPRLELPFTSKHIFPILHDTQKTSPIQKQITYRLIHSITGTTNHKNKFRTKKIHCTICRKLPETEYHLFTSCPSLSPLRIQLIRLLRLPHNTLHNRTQVLHRAILLNIYPFNNKAQSNIRNITLAHYRETIWNIRNSTKWDNKDFTQDTIVNIFTYKLKFHLKRYTTLHDWEQFYNT